MQRSTNPCSWSTEFCRVSKNFRTCLLGIFWFSFQDFKFLALVIYTFQKVRNYFWLFLVASTQPVLIVQKFFSYSSNDRFNSRDISVLFSCIDLLELSFWFCIFYGRSNIFGKDKVVLFYGYANRLSRGLFLLFFLFWLWPIKFQFIDLRYEWWFL